MKFFSGIPAPIRPVMVAFIRRQLRQAMHGHGIGRHSGTEIVALGTRSIDAMADFLGDKSFFMGSEPTGIDATMFAFAAGVLCPLFQTPLRTAAEKHDNLRRYVSRMTARFYPEWQEIAGCKAAAQDSENAAELRLCRSLRPEIGPASRLRSIGSHVR